MSLRRSPAALGAAGALVLALVTPHAAAADHDASPDHAPGHQADDQENGDGNGG